ncbi:hypothetical protein [Lactiplantibacillus xiangfangensis]|uniref:Uncharacterized protein n=1 Tax=Lactiplantibacillus xiangfangensis TaxID=942150 RepID=A0A0R2M4X6_9LACO|nr:hypothetical protein [Lactiplantibacillus xiangfangensis]KRO08407.1 hypothetical protein IV64_GL000492 [Lactiplantibacillus xiangfangensis]
MLILSIIGIIILVVGAIFFFIDYAKGNKKQMSSIIMVVGLILGIGGYFGHTYQVHQEQVRQAQIKKAKEKAFADNYSNISYYAYETGTRAEKVGNKLTKVWHAAIWDDGGITIDGQNYTDFNKALNAQSDLYTSNGTIDKLDSKLNSLESTYKELKQNVTSKNTDKLSKAKNVVKDTKDLVNIVENPSGNYATFSSHFSDADAKLSSDL